MTTTVFLIRHGAHDRLGRVLCGRMAGVTLGADGEAQARTLARRLEGEDLEAVYSSPLERARQTAAPIASALELDVEIDPDLDEIDFGAWNGARFDALHGDPLWRRWNEARSEARPPGGESMREVQDRMVRWLLRARARHPEGRIAAVGHGDPIKAALAYALGLTLDHHDRFEISPGSISVLATGEWGSKVLSMNEVPA